MVPQVDVLQVVTVDDGLDRELLAELLCLGAGFDEVVQMYLDTAPAQLAELAGAVASADLRDIGRTAHVLAGSSACVGAHRLSAACSELERAADAGRLPGAPHVAALHVDHARAATGLTELLGAGS